MTAQAADARAEPATDFDQRTVASLAKLGLPAETLPRHIAVIMDGNGRWARRQGKPRMFGHRAGAGVVRAIVTECASLKLDALTLYSFSIENWKRPSEEVECLMDLYVEYLNSERNQLMDNNVRFVQIGRRDPLPPRVLSELDKIVQCTEKNNGLTLVLAINYGSRTEIADAAAAIARDAKAGRLDPDEVTEDVFQQYLYTSALPDPDLLIRTAGEMRVSNYLLWQISYAELYVSDVCWPDFDVDRLHDAIRAYAGRKRKFGGVRDDD